MAFHVLVVDDSSVMRAMIIKTLRLSGLPVSQIYEATNGAEAWELLNEHWIDLALVDINMPIMTGEELIVKMRQKPELADLPIIVVSTEGSETRIAKLRELGAQFVHKPFSPEQIRQLIIEVTGVSDEAESGIGALSGSGFDF